MKWLKRVLRNPFSPTLGLDRRDPALAWLLHGMPWLQSGHAGRAGATAFLIGFAASVGYSVIAVHSRSSIHARNEGWVLLVFIGVRLLLDVMVLASAWRRMGSEYRSGRWDALRLSVQDDRALFRAIYAAAHAGVWRATMFALGIQSGAMLVIVFQWLAWPYNRGLFPVWPLVLIVMAGWELLVRPRATVAMGIVLSSSPHVGNAVLLGGTRLVFFWGVNLVAAFVALMVGLVGVLMIPETFVVRGAPALLVSTALSLMVFGLPFMVLMIIDAFVQRTALQLFPTAVADRDAAV